MLGQAKTTHTSNNVARQRRELIQAEVQHQEEEKDMGKASLARTRRGLEKDYILKQERQKKTSHPPKGSPNH